MITIACREAASNRRSVKQFQQHNCGDSISFVKPISGVKALPRYPSIEEELVYLREEN